MNRADDVYSSIRSVDSIGTRSLAGGIAPHMSGVGIFFQQESDGKVYVNTIVSGGSAERDGRMSVGDVMCSVDGRDVIGEPVSVLRSLLLGHERSYVVLTFALAVEPGEADHEGGTVIAKFHVELPRGSPEYFARVDATRRYEAEMQDLRYQLKTTLGEEKDAAEEVERVKRVLQLECGASARRSSAARHRSGTGNFCRCAHLLSPAYGAHTQRHACDYIKHEQRSTAQQTGKPCAHCPLDVHVRLHDLYTVRLCAGFIPCALRSSVAPALPIQTRLSDVAFRRGSWAQVLVMKYVCPVLLEHIKIMASRGIDAALKQRLRTSQSVPLSPRKTLSAFSNRRHCGEERRHRKPTVTHTLALTHAQTHEHARAHTHTHTHSTSVGQDAAAQT
jgi:hypothetical protein